MTKIFKVGKKRENELVAVKNLDLDVEQGEVFGFLGPNGAGKTTTVRMLTGLIHPSAGTARIAGFELGENDTEIRRNVGILTESPGMYDRLTAEKNLTIFAELYDVEDVPGAIHKYLTMLDLWDRRMDPVGSFSKGMRQKLAVARALLHEPKVLFLDEPTTGLDPEAAKTVRDFIEELKSKGRTIFMTTHNLDEAERLCDRVAIFQGEMLAVDTPANLRQQLYGRKVVFHLGGVDPAWLDSVRAIPGVTSVDQNGARLVVGLNDPELTNPEIVRSLVSNGADIRFIGEMRQSLEQVYLELVHGAGEERQA